MSYTIRNGFALGEEFWNFDFDSPMIDFGYTFEFEETCIPTNFTAMHRIENKDIPLPIYEEWKEKVR